DAGYTPHHLSLSFDRSTSHLNLSPAVISSPTRKLPSLKSTSAAILPPTESSSTSFLSSSVASPSAPTLAPNSSPRLTLSSATGLIPMEKRLSLVSNLRFVYLPVIHPSKSQLDPPCAPSAWLNSSSPPNSKPFLRRIVASTASVSDDCAP